MMPLVTFVEDQTRCTAFPRVVGPANTCTMPHDEMRGSRTQRAGNNRSGTGPFRFFTNTIAGEHCIFCSDAMRARACKRRVRINRRIDRTSVRLVRLFLLRFLRSHPRPFVRSWTRVKVLDSDRNKESLLWKTCGKRARCLSRREHIHGSLFSRKETIDLCDEKNQVLRSFVTLKSVRQEAA